MQKTQGNQGLLRNYSETETIQTKLDLMPQKPACYNETER